MLEVLTGTDDFSKYQYCKNWAKKEKQQFKFFKYKDWSEFESFLPSLYRPTLFSTDYCCYCDFHEGLSKKKLDVILEQSKILEETENSALFIGIEKAIKGLKKNKKIFHLPKPWKDKEWEELVRSEGVKMGLDLTDEQISRLVYDTGQDMWKIHNELRKFIDLSVGNKIDMKTFNDIFYSYTKEDLQNFVCDFANRNSLKALNRLDEILREYNPIQIIYRLTNVYSLILKIKLLSSGHYYTFNDLREIASKTQSNIPLLSQMVGFSFNRNEKKDNLTAQYSRSEIEQLLYEITFMELKYKSGTIDFRSEVIDFFEKTRR